MAEQNGKVNTKEQEAFAEFKRRVTDLIKPNHDDYYLRKWMKARSFDVKKAEEMFRNSMAYRHKHQVDRILQEYKPPKVLQEYLAGGFCGFDKEGSPVKVELFGNLDMKGLMCSAKKSDLEKTKLLQCEQITKQWQEQSEKLGRRVDGLVVIFDMKNAGSGWFWRPAMNMYLHLVKVLEDNYPEMMKRLFCINAPRIFPILWKIGQPLVSEDMKHKIFVLGSDYQDVLLKHVDPDQLPKFLGGTQTDPDGDPICRTKICQGGIVPKSYYLSESLGSEGFETVTVNRSEKMRLAIDVDLPATLMRWEFRTENYDIGFGIMRVDGDKEVEVVPITRFNSHQVAHDDIVICDKPGTYVILFDNSYSWMHTKTLHYTVELHTADDNTDRDLALLTGGSWTRLVRGMQITHL